MISPSKPLDEIQPNSVCVLNRACNVKLFLGPAPWGPREGSKGQISFNFNNKVIFKDFYTKLCVCSHKCKIQNISDGISFCRLGHAPGMGLWGAGVPRGSIFFKHGHAVYQSAGDDEQIRMQVNFSSYGQTGGLG